VFQRLAPTITLPFRAAQCARILVNHTYNTRAPAPAPARKSRGKKTTQSYRQSFLEAAAKQKKEKTRTKQKITAPG